MSGLTVGDDDHATLMNGVYRHQRHIYDLSRKYFLLGRDRMIADLYVPAGGTVLELGCGTGRNLHVVARRYPDCRVFGLDISEAMLETAKTSLARAGLGDRSVLAAGDASRFDAGALFGLERFDRVLISYSLSMIPPWRGSIEAGLACVAPGGSLHIVDFGDQAGLPRVFRVLLDSWLHRFHVHRRDDLANVARASAERLGAQMERVDLYRGYATSIRIALPRETDLDATPF